MELQKIKYRWFKLTVKLLLQCSLNVLNYKYMSTVFKSICRIFVSLEFNMEEKSTAVDFSCFRNCIQLKVCRIVPMS